MDGEIRGEDVHRVLESARSVVNPINYEILHEYSLKPKLHIDINFMYIYYVDFCVISKNVPDTFGRGVYI